MVTRRVSLSLPEDVSAVLDEQENASKYVAEAIRMRRKRELMADIMARHGYLITEAGKRRMGRALKLKQQQIVAARGEEPQA